MSEVCNKLKLGLWPVLVASLLVLAGITGCGNEGNAEKATQVAARVNSDEITVHQINYFLTRKQNVTPEGAPEAKREILDKLIDQQLVRQKAIENKLDRSPDVVQAIEAAKSEILARAYLDQLAAAVPKPAAWEIQKYYAEHPELFSLRRQFELEEFVFKAEGDLAAGLRERLSTASSMKEIADWLQSREIRFAANRGVRAAEQIPLAVLPKLQPMKAGDIALFEMSGGSFHVIRLVGFKVDPVDEATATPRIQQFLYNQRSSEYVARHLKQIKEQAKIEYLGEFTAGAEEQRQKAPTEAPAEAKGSEASSPEQSP
jgi:EpsD family peptidyl-prolyl cis-trans isomerase